jgi:hypothetical protein
VSARLSTGIVTALIGKVVIEGVDIGRVVQEFLRANGLL